MAKRKTQKINKIQIHYDSQGNTLNVWFDKPEKEYISEETGEEVILNKDKKGKVIGFEKLNYIPSKVEQLFPTKILPVEVMVL